MATKNALEQIDVLNCVNLRLRMLNRLVNKLYADPLREVGISTCQQSIMFMVGKMKRISQNELGKALFLERSTVTREINGLVAKGFIRKTDDFPSPVLALSKSGENALRVMVPLWSNIQEQVLDVIGKDGSSAINKVLNSLRK